MVNKTSLFSWPPNPSLVSFQLLLRLVLLVVNIIGIGLSFATAAAYRYESNTMGIVSGSFQVVSVIVLPWIILWNHRIIRRSSNMDESSEKQPQQQPHFGIKILQFSTVLDAIAFVAYIIVYAVFMDTTISHSYWGNAVLATHASITPLISFVVHGMLLVSQALQLRAALPPRMKYRCPNCLSSMESFHSSVSEQSLLTVQGAIGEAVPGQETGTCERTPRASEASQRLVKFDNVNEDGEAETDTLLEQDA